MATLRVLVVDDQPAMARAIRRQLRDCEVLAVETLDDARVLLAATTPDVVLCDLDLGGERGTDLLEELAAEHSSQTRRVLYSGNATSAAGEVLANGCVHAVLDKPWSLSDLRAAVGLQDPNE